jgi:hypothetical protein
LVLISELEPHIDDDHLIFVLEAHTVQSHLLSSTEWDHTKCSLFERLRTLLWDMEELLECLLWCEKRIGPLGPEAIFEDKRIARTKIGLDVLS